jgi:hypothetical protein
VTQSALWLAAAGMTVLTIASGFADHLRGKRNNLDRPGWVPWTLIQIVALVSAIVAVAIAIRI